jgi:hypothetical protein
MFCVTQYVTRQFHEVANNFNNIVILIKPITLQTIVEKLSTRVLQMCFFCNRLGFDLHLLNKIYLCCYVLSAAELITPRLPFCMQDSIIAPRWKVWKNLNIREPS